MANSQSESEQGEEMSYELKISQDGHSGSHRQLFGQEGGGSASQRHRLVILSLTLLNAVLLIAAVVIGIYCAKADYLQVPHSAATPLMIEMNYLRNHTDIIRAELNAKAELARQRVSHLQLKLQVKQTIGLNDNLQRQIEILRIEKTNLQSNKTTLDGSCGRCPQGWSFLKSSCYYFSDPVSNSKKNWPESRAHCISQGGDLLVINNLEEQTVNKTGPAVHALVHVRLHRCGSVALFAASPNHLWRNTDYSTHGGRVISFAAQQLISDNFPRLRGHGVWWQNGFWIGLTDVGTSGTWVWVNNVTEVETMYWRSGQPSRSGPQSGNCIAFYYFPDIRGTWYNGNCLEHIYNWICEMKPSKI